MKKQPTRTHDVYEFEIRIGTFSRGRYLATDETMIQLLHICDRRLDVRKNTEDAYYWRANRGLGVIKTSPAGYILEINRGRRVFSDKSGRSESCIRELNMNLDLLIETYVKAVDANMRELQHRQEDKED